MNAKRKNGGARRGNNNGDASGYENNEREKGR